MNTETILRLPQVLQRTGISRSTLYSLIRVGQFKKPIAIGTRAVGWLSSDIDEFIDSRVAASRHTD